VLFDEIEKAHRRLHNLLLQVLEEGELHDGRGRCLDLRECIVVLTSNAGSDEIERAADGLGFGGRSLARSGAEEIARNALRRSFPPELLGRVDETVVFRVLSPADARAIAADQLTDLARRARRSGVRVRLSSAVARWVAERGHDEAHGARGIARIVRSTVEGPLSEAILERSADGPRWFAVTIAGGRPRVRAAD
jgi:ATP-dependent Clp protease ATP-binding subunit ClpC